MREGILAGQVALVTGASRGIGRAIALHLAAAGAAVGLLARDAAALAIVVGEIGESGGRALALPADVTQREQVERAVSSVSTQLGPVSILVNNAGRGGPFGPIGVVDAEEWWRSQSIHVRGALLGMSLVLPTMRARRAGRIISVSSRAGLDVVANLSSYCVAKATQIRLAEHVDAENRELGVRAFVFQPGTVITDMARDSMADPEAQKWAPFLVDGLAALLDEDPAPGLDRIGRFVVALASGRHDALAGRYVDLDQEWESMFGATRSG